LINSALEALRHSNCLEEDPHLASATGLIPRQINTRKNNPMSGFCRIDEDRVHETASPLAGSLTFRFISLHINIGG
jgi:hypothetical protein